MAPLILFSVRKHHAGGPAQALARPSTALAPTNHDKGGKAGTVVMATASVLLRGNTSEKIRDHKLLPTAGHN
jgi:hypothetical protein